MSTLILVLGIVVIVLPAGVLAYRMERSAPHVDRIPLGRLFDRDTRFVPDPYRGRPRFGPDQSRVEVELAMLAARRRDSV